MHRGYDNESLEVWFGVKGLATVGFSGFREMEQKLWFACGIPQLWCEGSGQVGLKAMVLVVKYFFFSFFADEEEDVGEVKVIERI